MTHYYYKCTFDGPFPLDMLRYDNMIAAREADSHAIVNSLDPTGVQVPRTIYLRALRALRGSGWTVQERILPRDPRPSIERWKSFGISIDIERIEFDEIPPEAGASDEGASR